MEMLDWFSAWMQHEGAGLARAWLGDVVEACRRDPWPAGLLLVGSLAASVASRSVTILVASTFFCAVATTAAASSLPDQTRLVIWGLAIAAQMLVGVYVGLARRRQEALRRALTKLEAVKADLEYRLDREVTWRMAAEPPKPQASTGTTEDAETLLGLLHRLKQTSTLAPTGTF
jgi:hypothetical protein